MLSFVLQTIIIICSLRVRASFQNKMKSELEYEVTMLTKEFRYRDGFDFYLIACSISDYGYQQIKGDALTLKPWDGSKTWILILKEGYILFQGCTTIEELEKFERGFFSQLEACGVHLPPESQTLIANIRHKRYHSIDLVSLQRSKCESTIYFKTGGGDESKVVFDLTDGYRGRERTTTVERIIKINDYDTYLPLSTNRDVCEVHHDGVIILMHVQFDNDWIRTTFNKILNEVTPFRK